MLLSGLIAMKSLRRCFIIGFIAGVLVPLFWGILSFFVFNAPENWISHAYWRAVYLTCPFWIIEGNKALILMPLLNGLAYAVLCVAIASSIRGLLGKRRP